MLIRKKVSNPIATIVFLALAASTALRLRSWPAAETTTSLPADPSSDARRKLEHATALPGHHQSNSYYDKLWRELKRTGEIPGTETFESALRNRVSKQELALIDELSRYRSSESAFDRTWQKLVQEGKFSPGTPTFERLLQQRGVRREERRENEILKNLSFEARKAEKQLNEARKAFEEATKYMSASERKALLMEEETILDTGERNRKLEVMEEAIRDDGETPSERRNMKDEMVWLQGDYGVGGIKVAAMSVDEMEEALNERLKKLEGGLNEAAYQPLEICDRNADVGSTEDFASLQKYAQCPDITQDKPILLLEGMRTHGRTGNNLIEFLHAIQEARDKDIQLGIMYSSWAMELLLQMWLAIESDDWQSQFEQAFCVKIFKHESELKGWDVIHQDTKELFFYTSEIPFEDYVESQEYQLRQLFRNYNTGEGKDLRGRQVQDMCSGIDAVFGTEDRATAMYSVIHSRSLEGEPGFRLLGILARRSGCDPVAALEMTPEYVKAILEPLGMMEHPIVFITDGQNSAVLEGLLADPEIGPMIRTVPEEACWIGGDLTLAVMSNAFIGNPASTFTGFIAKSRLALGFGHNYLFRAKDKKTGEWKEVCGEHCIFDKSIMHVMS